MTWQLAQLNIALPLEPLDSERLAGFVAGLDPVNALAESSPGFVWRLQTEDGDATAVRGFGDDRLIVNLSVWQSLTALASFVYGGGHVEVMRRRREWFVPMREAFTVLWWVPAGHRPDVAEAEARLDLLQRSGSTAEAFTFRSAFPAPGTDVPAPGIDAAGSPDRDDWSCPV